MSLLLQRCTLVICSPFQQTRLALARSRVTIDPSVICFDRSHILTKMASSHQLTYVLSYRQDNVEQNESLRSQHEAIKHRILHGQLIHPSICTSGSRTAIADLGCGTGIWLDDIANTLFRHGHATTPDSAKLIGFDTNPHAFSPNLAPRRAAGPA